MPEDDEKREGGRTFALTLSDEIVERMEKAMTRIGVDQEAFLSACVMRGIKEAERVNKPRKCKSLWELTGRGHGKKAQSRDTNEAIDDRAAKEIEWLERWINLPSEDNSRGR